MPKCFLELFSNLFCHQQHMEFLKYPKSSPTLGMVRLKILLIWWCVLKSTERHQISVLSCYWGLSHVLSIFPCSYGFHWVFSISYSYLFHLFYNFLFFYSRYIPLYNSLSSLNILIFSLYQIVLYVDFIWGEFKFQV